MCRVFFFPVGLFPVFLNENAVPIPEEDVMDYLEKRKNLLDGVCVSGGEPLLRPEFIRQFHALCSERWKITLETSLNVPLSSLQTVASLVNDFIIDIKDANDEIYKAYTGKSNAQVWENLAWLAANYDLEHVFLRVPLIPEFNTEEDRERSVERLSKLGFGNFDRFTYRVTTL